ncbi:hypothetical protein B0H12DRAFT_473635 [Mycena haematopus]|nr:hypothetical protein B0H12DRAFT_473635 [Mycena haematopus]
MNTQCIPANPDISGIGVRVAIYAQNLLCFAPVVAHLWDGRVSVDEIRGVKDQSIGMLAIAFAILISSIIQATSVGSGGLTKFHAAIILDLSWMNNTVTWIWFLLYAHHLTRPGEGNGTPATWSAWMGVLVSPLRELVAKTGPAHLEKTVDAERDLSSGGLPTQGGGLHIAHERRTSESMSQVQNPTQSVSAVLHRAWYFVSQTPVLTLGSIHLSLMAGIGLWLWSNPSKFGTYIPCDPLLTIVGGTVPFSSLGLRAFSLAMYSLLVIPGLNLVLPFLFFLLLHLSYNKSRSQHPIFWGRLDTLLNLVCCIPQMSREAIPRLARAIFRRPCSLSRHSETGSPSPLRSDPSSNTPDTEKRAVEGKTAFLVVGLVCLAVINIVLLVDIELTLRRNQHEQFRGEDEWGFGQVLALLLLVIPVRDFVTSVLDVRDKVKNIQREFEKHLEEAVLKNTLMGHDFKDLIERGADPNVERKGDHPIKTLLQFAAHVGNQSLVGYLQEHHVEDKDGELVSVSQFV